MKKRTLRRRIIATVLAVLMLVPMLILPGSAAATDALPTTEFFYQSSIKDGYYCDSYVYTYSNADINSHFTDASMDFVWAGDDEETIYATEMYYQINHRISYVTHDDFDSLGGSVIVYEYYYLDLNDIYVRIHYDMTRADLCNYIFGSFEANLAMVGAIKPYKDVDFALDITDQ